MSKSLGNVMDPLEVINGGKSQPGVGADVLRTWVASSAFVNDVGMDPGAVKQATDTYRKIRGTLRFLLAGLTGFDPE